jgi:hypothetical protein
MVTRKEETPITLAWKDKSVGKSGEMEEKSDVSEKKKIEVQASGRKRKQPVAKRRFFMDIKSYKGSVKKTKTFNGNINQCQIVSVLHQNVQSLKSKLLELDVLLQDVCSGLIWLGIGNSGGLF